MSTVGQGGPIQWVKGTVSDTAKQMKSKRALAGHTMKSNPPPQIGGVRKSLVNVAKKMKPSQAKIESLKGMGSSLTDLPGATIQKAKTVFSRTIEALDLATTNQQEQDIVLTRTDTPTVSASGTLGKAPEKANPEHSFVNSSGAIGSAAVFLRKADDAELKGHLEVMNDFIREMAKANRNPEQHVFTHAVADVSEEFTQVLAETAELGLESQYQEVPNNRDVKEVKPDGFKTLTPQQRAGLRKAKKQLESLQERNNSLMGKVGDGTERFAQIAVDENIKKALKEVNQLLGLPTAPKPQVSPKH